MPVVTGETGEEVLEQISDKENILHTHTHGALGSSAVTLFPEEEMDQLDGPFTCPFCNFTADYVEDSDEYDYYYREDEGEFVCVHCKYSHEDEPQVKRHITMQHNNGDGEE